MCLDNQTRAILSTGPKVEMWALLAAPSGLCELADKPVKGQLSILADRISNSFSFIILISSNSLYTFQICSHSVPQTITILNQTTNYKIVRYSYSFGDVMEIWMRILKATAIITRVIFFGVLFSAEVKKF